MKTNLFPSHFISKKQILLIAAIKGLIALLYGELCLKHNWGDSHAFFKSGVIFTKMFHHDPLLYLKTLTVKHMNPLPEKWIPIYEVDRIPFGTLNRSGFISRVHSLISIVSKDFYPTHAILFSFLSLIGIFYMCFILSKYSSKTNFISKFFVYFVPSILFWTSGAHKDALITFGLGMILLTFYKSFFEKKFIYIIGFVLACAFSYYVRNYTFYLFIPGLATFAIAHLLKDKVSPIITYASLMLLGVTAFFIAPSIHHKLNFLERFVAVQDHFLNLKGNSNFYMKPLEPTFKAFITAFPKALWHSITKPNLSYTDFPLAIFAAFENFVLIGLGFASLFFIRLKQLTKEQLNVALLCLGFGFFFYTLIGLTVSNIGALVRYKSVGLIFIVFGLATLIDTNKLNNFTNKFSPFKLTDNGIR